jgi:hypothetical protein
MVIVCGGTLSQRCWEVSLRRVKDWVGRRLLDDELAGQAGTWLYGITTPDAEMQCNVGNKITTCDPFHRHCQ